MVPVTLEIQILWTKFLSTSTVPLTTVVTFTDMTEWPEPPRGQPQMHWKLPFDIFFPFKVALNLERSYRGDLGGYFLLILIMSSILCFWKVRWTGPVLTSSVSELIYSEYDPDHRLFSSGSYTVPIYVPSVLGLSHMTSFCPASSHVPILHMHHLWTSLQWNTWEMEGSRDVALIRNEKGDIKMNIPCSQKPRVLSKPRSMERGATSNPSILELHSVIFLLEKHLIFPHGTNWTFKIQEPSQAAWIVILWVVMSASHL